jgi:outer membrane lipoprotein-sorting protein
MSQSGKLLRAAIVTACVLLLAGLAGPGSVVAQDTEAEADPKPAPTSAVGISSSWSTQTSVTGATGSMVLDERQRAVVDAISGYFNGIEDLQGSFLQTDPQQQQAKGYFYLKRPGRFRFVYAPPSKLVVLSDGQYLSYEDYDLKSVDRYPLDATPFRILLQPVVNLAEDAHILDLAEAPDLITLTIQDKAEDSAGAIRLFFTRNGDALELKEWVISTPQGGDTRVEVAELQRTKITDKSLFTPNSALLMTSKEKRN